MKRFIHLVIIACIAVLAAILLTSAAPAEQPTGRVNYYETECQYQARSSRGIPPLTLDQSAGLVAWTQQHLESGEPDVELSSYWDALDACPPAPKFNWDSMILVHTEVSS